MDTHRETATPYRVGTICRFVSDCGKAAICEIVAPYRLRPYGDDMVPCWCYEIAAEAFGPIPPDGAGWAARHRQLTPLTPPEPIDVHEPEPEQVRA